MRALLLGSHPDAVDLAVALASAGVLDLAAFAGPPHVTALWQGRGWPVQVLRDVEAALALRNIDWIIVGDELPHRPLLLKRALQSERHVLAVHPADLEPDVCYEALLILGDTKKRLAPLLPERATAAFAALAEALQTAGLGPVQRIEVEYHFPPPPSWEAHPLLHVWHLPRLAAGEIQELTALSLAEEPALTAPLAISGRCQAGAFFQIHLTPRPGLCASLRLAVKSQLGELEWVLPSGWFGSGLLQWRTSAAEQRCELPETARSAALLALGQAAVAGSPLAAWTDATRCLELFSATRQSMRRRRLVVMEYESLGEVGNFKSTMAALGCGLMLLVMVLFFTVPTVPWLKWLILPLLLVFLALQGLRWLARDEAPPPPQPRPPSECPPANT